MLLAPSRTRALLAAVLVVALSACSLGSSEGPDDSSSKGRPATTHRSPAPQPTRGEAAVARMTLRQKAGQVIVASWSGTGSPAPMVRRLHLGGVVALEPNIASLSQIRRVNRSVARVAARRGYPAFIAVDQEGGVVRRVHLGVTPFPAFMSAGAADDPALTRRTARISAAEMRGLGFDVVLAPDADVSVGDRDAVVGSRAAGGRPDLVARHVVAAVDGIESAGVLPVVKHFPGHGSLDVDSHRGLPVQRRGMRELRATDLVPFAAAIRAQAPAVMTGHIAVRALDRDVPASVSRRVTTGLLRREMGFDGLVVTDALDMAGSAGARPGWARRGPCAACRGRRPADAARPQGRSRPGRPGSAQRSTPAVPAGECRSADDRHSGRHAEPGRPHLTAAAGLGRGGVAGPVASRRDLGRRSLSGPADR